MFLAIPVKLPKFGFSVFSTFLVEIGRKKSCQKCLKNASIRDMPTVYMVYDHIYNVRRDLLFSMCHLGLDN